MEFIWQHLIQNLGLNNPAGQLININSKYNPYINSKKLSKKKSKNRLPTALNIIDEKKKNYNNDKHILMKTLMK